MSRVFLGDTYFLNFFYEFIRTIRHKFSNLSCLAENTWLLYTSLFATN